MADEIRRGAQRVLWFVFALLLAMAPRGYAQSPQSSTCGSLPPGAVACWPASGSGADLIGDADGQLQGNVTFARGVSGDAFVFDGASGSVMVPDTPVLDFTTAFTLAAWVNPSAAMHDPAHGGIISKVGGAAGGNGYQWGLVGGNSLLAVQFNAAGETWPANQLLVNLPSPVPVGQWTHLATSYDGNALTLYVNGQQVGSLVVGPKTIVNSSASFRISGDDNHNVRFKGMVDEVVAFNRALSPAEVTSMAQRPLSIDTPISIANAALNQSFAQTITAAGGTAPYTYSIAAGSLPPGLSLSSNGVLSGATQSAGSFAFTVAVADAAGAVAQQAYVMAVVLPSPGVSFAAVSDGRLGPAAQYFSDDWHQFYINTDNGVFYRQFSNFPFEELPSPPKRVVSQRDGSEVMLFDFTDFVIGPGVRVWIIGSRPAAILSQGDITIAGLINPHSHFFDSLMYSNGGRGAVRPEGNFDVGAGGSAPSSSALPTGGGGGGGAGSVFISTTPWGWDLLTGAGGGGGGGAVPGAPGLNGVAIYGTSSSFHAGGLGGFARGADLLEGGGGGGQGGYAHTWYCCWTGAFGGNGGGAVLFSTPGQLTITQTGEVHVDGVHGRIGPGDAGAGGGGGGGDLRFAASQWQNLGVISARGGPGGVSEHLGHYTADGGGGGGGRVAIEASSIVNAGTIDVSAGGGTIAHGGTVSGSSTIDGAGTIAGIGSGVTSSVTTGGGYAVAVRPSRDVSVTFSEVTSSGITTSAAIDGNAAPQLPSGMTPTAIAFDIATTAAYQGPLTVCFIVPSIADQATFGRLRVLHGESGLLVDRTILSPDSPAPNFPDRRICARVSSLSPFVLALMPEQPHVWHADYKMEWEGPRTSDDHILDGAYSFFYTWRFGILNDGTAALESPSIVVDTTIAALTPDQPPNVSLRPVYPPFEWTGPQLSGPSVFFTSLWSDLPVPTPYPLGYDTSKNLSGGLLPAGATEARIFTVSITPRDSTIRQAGITVDFAFFLDPGPHPVIASNVSCSSAHGTPEPLAGPGQLGVAISIGDEINQPLEQGETYELTCTVTLTNNGSSAARYSPGVTVSGHRLLDATETHASTAALTTDATDDPADPLGSVHYSVSASGQLIARLAKRFVRTVHFDSVNAMVDGVPPTTTVTTQPLQPNGDHGWFRTGLVGVTLSAADQSNGSGVGSVSYSLSGAQLLPLTVIQGPFAGFGINAAGAIDVTFFATDRSGNVEAARTVTIKRDSMPPQSQAAVSPAPLNGWIAGAAQVTVTASDATSGVQRICATLTGAQPQPTACVNGSSMTLSITAPGSTSVSYHAVDMAGNIEASKPPLTVMVDTAPSVSTASAPPPGPQGFYSGNVTVTLSATDNFGIPFSGVRRIRYALNGTEQAPIMGLSGIVTITADGETVLTYWSEDRAGNSEAPRAMTIVINRDNVPPVILVAGGGTHEATSPAGAAVSFSVTAVDAVSGPRPVTCVIDTPEGSLTISSPFTFPLGSTTVTCRANDAAGNAGEATFTVTVQDHTPPVVSVSDMAAIATVAGGIAVEFVPAPSAIDLVSGGLTPACSATSGAVFPIGETVVTCTATDGAGNHGTATFTVTVVDGVPPTLSLPSTITAIAYSIGGTPVSYVVTASDGQGAASFTCTPASGSMFPVGLTTVSCTAIDAHGNELAGSFNVEVTLADNRIGRFVAFSRDATWLRANATVVRGDIGANDRKLDSHLHGEDVAADAVVYVGEGVRLQQVDSRVVGSTTVLANGSRVYSVISNFLIQRPRAEILGTLTGTMTAPYLAMPAFPAITAGTLAKTVGRSETVTLPAGTYGAVSVKQNATLVLAGGTYRMRSLELERGATVVFRAATELHIKQEVHTAAKARMILDASVPGLRAAQMVMYVEGDDSSCVHDAEQDEDGDNPGRTAVHLGQGNVVQANIYALNGTVWLKSKTTATGSFIGQHVRVGQNVTMTLDSAWQ